MDRRLLLRGQGHRCAGASTAASIGPSTWSRTGGGVVEGDPEVAESVRAGFLFHGALSTYERRLGFARDRRIGKHRWVVIRTVGPTW